MSEEEITKTDHMVSFSSGADPSSGHGARADEDDEDDDDDGNPKKLHDLVDGIEPGNEFPREKEVHEEYDLDIDKYPVREYKLQFKRLKDPVAFNPLVTLLSILVLWGVAGWSMAQPEESSATLTAWRSAVSLKFTWLFMGSKGVFFFFIVYVGIKYGKVKLGRNDEEPEFSTPAYFAMIFAAGVAVGLFVFGVSEPLWHQTSNYYANSGYHSQDEIDMFAINLTVTNWAINGWAPYLMVAIAMSLAGHRFNLPMTFRSCFYPIFGHYTWGWIGDLVDTLAVIVTVAGVCTSLGLGAIQVVAGFQYLGWIEEDATQDQLSRIQAGTIWAITAVATVSVMSGLSAGIKTLSFVAFLLGLALMFLVFVMDNTKFLLNLLVQEVGYYLQWSILQLNFWTGAFGQLREGEGRNVDDAGAEAWWMDAWMVFYQAWWVSWSCFVGLFVARISRGRTVGEVILYSLVAPTIYCMLWFCIWGGVGIRQSRQALEMQELGMLQGDETLYQTAYSTFCYDVPQADVVVNDTTVFTNHLYGVTPVCKFNPDKADFAAFNVLYSFSFPGDFDVGFGPTLTVIFIISLTIYFATSSDSGSFVVDHLAANGRLHHHWIQRLFWALTEGAVATALLTAGGPSALSAIQAGSIVFGLPFAVLLCYLVPTILAFVNHAESNPDSFEYPLSEEPTFSMPVYGGVFNVAEWVASLGGVNPKRVDMGMNLPSKFQTVEFFKGLLIPVVPLKQVLDAVYPRSKTSNTMVVITYGVFFYGFVAIMACVGTRKGLKGWGWLAMFCAATLLTSVRGGFRGRYHLRSNVIGDFISSLFVWPQVLGQMRQHCVELGLPNDKVDEDDLAKKPPVASSQLQGVEEDAPSSFVDA